jgi:hydroxymethylbilane synthase
VPIGAYAQRVDGGWYLRGFVASPDGKKYVRAEERVQELAANPEEIGQAVAEQLMAGGAREILAALTHE